MRALIFAAGLLLLYVALTGCATVPVKDPCGVIRDSLLTVTGKTPFDQQRIDAHYERGRVAGCWK